MARRLTTTKKFINHGVLNAEVNSFLKRELAEEGYAGVEIRNAPVRTEIIIRATKTQNVLGDKGRRIRELSAVIKKRFFNYEGAPEVELYAERVFNRGLCAEAQAESLRYKLIGGLPVRRACYGVLRFIMQSGAKGCEVIVSGKLRAQRAKSKKFLDGYMIKSGQGNRDYVVSATRHVFMRQGILGVKINIMMPHDPTGREGVAKVLGDVVKVLEPKPEPKVTAVPASAAVAPVA